MNADPVILDDASAAKLVAANGHKIPLCDTAGTVVGYGVSPERMRVFEMLHSEEMARVHANWSDEEIAAIIERRRNDQRPSIPHDEAMRRLGLQLSSSTIGAFSHWNRCN